MAAVEPPPFAHQKRFNSWHTYGQFDLSTRPSLDERPISRDSAKAKQMLGLVTRLPNPQARERWGDDADPRPESRDSLKAKKMLGLVQDPPVKAPRPRIKREKSKTTRWLERPMYEALDSSELESDIAEADQASVSQRTILPHELQTSPLTYDSQESEPVPKPWLRLERPASFQSSPPTSPISTSSSDPFSTKPWTRSERPRPVSYVSSVASCRTDGRRNSKIASSRGFRTSSHPNFSRPFSGLGHRSVPGESIENDPIYNQYEDDEVGPPTPSSPIGPTIEDSLGKGKKEGKHPKRRSGRWSSIPQSFMRFARRRSSNAVEEPKPEFQKNEPKIIEPPLNNNNNDVIYQRQTFNLTEDNLHRFEGELNCMPRTNSNNNYDYQHTPGLDFLPMPERSPLMMEHSLFDSPLSSPQLNLRSASPSASFTSRTRHNSGARSPSSINITSPTSIHYNHNNLSPNLNSTSNSTSNNKKPTLHLSISIPSPSLASPPGSPSLSSRSLRNASPMSRVCVLCRDAKHVSAFPSRRVTAACMHVPGACLECVRGWVDSCIENCVLSNTSAQRGSGLGNEYGTGGWDHCSCPECGELMAYEDVGAFAGEKAFLRYDTHSLHATLSALPNFIWCANPACDKGQIFQFRDPASSSHSKHACSAAENTYPAQYANVGNGAFGSDGRRGKRDRGMGGIGRGGDGDGEVHEDDEEGGSLVPVFRCTSCDFTFCVRHRDVPFAFHVGIGCRDVDNLFQRRWG